MVGLASETAGESKHWPSVALQPKRLFLGWREGHPLLDVHCYILGER